MGAAAALLDRVVLGPAVTDKIGRQDRRLPSLDALFGHRDRFPQSGVVGEILCGRGGQVHEGRMTASSNSPVPTGDVSFIRFGR